MICEEIFTFKTRRKMNIFCVAFVFMSLIAYAIGAPHEVCPEQCDCYVDLKFEYNLHTAACTHLVWKKTYFPNIVQLKLKPAAKDVQCQIPDIASKIFPKLQRLDVSNCSLTHFPTPGVNSFSSLISLDLSNNSVREIPSNALLPYGELQHLTMNNNPLDPQSPLVFESTSLYDLSLDSCNILNLTTKTFAGLPNLKYLSISNNNISALPYKVFPEHLKSLNLSRNKLVNVPTFEFTRLEALRQLSIAANPVNCTCALIEFQDWIPRKPLVIWDPITCAFPHEYNGLDLAKLPEKNVCPQDESLSKDKCAPNQICNGGTIIDEGYLNDQDKDENEDVFRKDGVMPVTSNDSMIVEDINSEQLDGSGDGDGDSTAKPLDEPKSVETSSIPSTTIAAETPSTSSTESSPPSKEGVVVLQNELDQNVTTSTETSVSSTSTTVSSASSSEAPATTQHPTTENETVTPEMNRTAVVEVNGTAVMEVNGTNSELQEHLRHHDEHREMYGYIIPGVAVLLVGCVCLVVYCSQCASRVDSYKPTETNAEGAELQEVSLLPDSNHPTIIKHSNKYPGEKENGQTERLMHGHDQNGGNNLTPEVNGNESQHSDDTIDCCKLANGQSTTNQSPPKNVECTVVKVTTLPDSIPKTAVIRDL